MDGNKILDCEIAVCPPSVNHYWVAAGKRRYLSKRAKDFIALVALFVKPHKTTARLGLDITFHFPDRRTRDIDNHLKAVLDALVKARLCVDDEQFDVLHVKRGSVVKGGLVTLKVIELGV